MLKNALLATAMGLSIYALSAQAGAGHRPTGWYIAVEGGGNWIDDGDVQFQSGALVSNWEAEFESGWAVFAEVGYRWSNNWRLELEGGWRENKVDCIDFGPGPCVDNNYGELSQFTQMINVIHDIDLSPRTSLGIGLGFGGNFVEVDTRFGAVRDDEDFAIAGQALVQLSHELGERLDFVLTYRYMTSDDPEFRLTGPRSIEYENENHSLTIGLRFDLQADAAPVVDRPVGPPPPPPPPSEPKQFIVFFGFNKTSLPRDAIAVIQEAAETAQRDGYASILVTGHTDTVGSARYNKILSERRAHVVKRALVNQGIRPEAISAEGKGETMLLVQTGDREMEPRNRRVTIDIDGDTPEPDSATLERLERAEPVAARAPEKRVERAEKVAMAAPSFAAPIESGAASPGLDTPRIALAPAVVQTDAEETAPLGVKRSGVDEETLQIYKAWISAARMKHPYADSEARMYAVMMCESGGKALSVNDAGHSGLFQYSGDTWRGGWNDYRGQDMLDAKAQIFATAQAWQRNMQRQWGCYTKAP